MHCVVCFPIRCKPASHQSCLLQLLCGCRIMEPACQLQHLQHGTFMLQLNSPVRRVRQINMMMNMMAHLALTDELGCKICCVPVQNTSDNEVAHAQNTEHAHMSLYQADDRAGAMLVRPTGHRLSQSAHYPATAGRLSPHSASARVHCSGSRPQLSAYSCC